MSYVVHFVHYVWYLMSRMHSSLYLLHEYTGWCLMYIMAPFIFPVNYVLCPTYPVFYAVIDVQYEVSCIPFVLCLVCNVCPVHCVCDGNVMASKNTNTITNQMISFSHIFAISWVPGQQSQCLYSWLFALESISSQQRILDLVSIKYMKYRTSALSARK